MEELTKTEEKIMQALWELKSAFVKDIIEKMDEDPKPPYNTISSVVRILEKKGYVGYKAYGKTYEYFPIIAKAEYAKKTFKKILNNYFDNSASSLLSFLVKEESISSEELDVLKSIIDGKTDKMS
ncbi:BlaI/MecI/CopY family transcriptional regulator [Arcicella aquatica]|uniref:BlaI/MecI/CopY family transcriptional regulator n=1 Tax=Arcicella aquatica TaxID=217141 RepID=A0ABU5QSL3_9BACT|nr:BlaI/MecI/CopY family transcriptional regulator [Arcicella aquatica]MEA5260086.1 BlaI/MecI/CopY family transcriptional regulator [Arcicella aquatica]